MSIFNRKFRKSVIDCFKSHNKHFETHGEMILTLNKDYLKLLDKTLKLEARIKELEEKQNS